MHHRHAVAALCLVHEVGGNEDRHPVATRQLDEQPPEVASRATGIDAGGRLVQNQQLGLVHHGDCQRQALAYAQRQAGRQGVDALPPGRSASTISSTRPGMSFGLRHAEQACACNSRFWRTRDFAVERECLRHVADAAAGRPSHAGPPHDRTARRRPSLAGKQAGEHLHRRGLAAAVGAEEAEDFTAPDAEGHADRRRRSRQSASSALCASMAISSAPPSDKGE
jgi:hypothetical protein